MERKKFKRKLLDKKSSDVLKTPRKPLILKETATYKDDRLDKVMPLVVDVLTKLLGSAGMMRYRQDFTTSVSEIMDGDVKKAK